MSVPPPLPAPRAPTATSAVTTLAVLGAGLTVLVAVALFFYFQGGYSATITSWQIGSPDVSGTVANTTGQGCTDPEITLTLRDHNQAVGRTFTFGAGELAAGTHRGWTTHMVGLLGIPQPVESNVDSISVDVRCADQH